MGCVIRCLLLGALLLSCATVGAATLRVGPDEAVRSIAEAARMAQDGDVVEIVAANYSGDVAVWPQSRLTIRGVGGRPVVSADGRSAEGKGIWVIRGADVLVENIVFRGARVPDRNGSGIRHERGRLTVRNCLFDDNEMGILTANQGSLVLIVENSEFAHGVLVRPHLSHLLYAGRIARLEVRGSYFHHGLVGHLLKSRARVSLIEYSRLTDERDGRASYELDFPNGGEVILVGNLVQQSARTENERMISFGAEGLIYGRNTVFLSSNTLMDDLPDGGEFLSVWSPGRVSVKAFNNLLVSACSGLYCVEGRIRQGAHKMHDRQLPWRGSVFPLTSGNRHVYGIETGSSLTEGVFRPKPDSDFRSIDPGRVGDVSLVPRREYQHPAHSRALPAGLPTVPGAFQP